MRILVPIIVTLLAFSLQAYNRQKAEEFYEFFKTFTDKNVAKKMQKLCPEKLLKRMDLGEKFTFIDIRTEKEKEMISVFKGKTINLTMDKVFKPENLSKIPKDQNVVIVCKSGLRAVGIAMALRQCGFNKIFILGGGIKKLETNIKP